MKVITFSNEKGGVGKTSTATHAAAGLAIQGYRVLLIDTDPQDSNASKQWRIPKGIDDKVLYDLLIKDAEWADCLVQPTIGRWAGGYEVKGKLFFLPSDLQSRVIPMMTNEVKLLHDRLREVEDYVDVVIIDTSPTPSLLQAMIHIASDYMIYPTQCERPSIEGVKSSRSTLRQSIQNRMAFGLPATQLIGVLPTMYRSNTITHKQGLSAMRKEFGDLLWSPIHERITWGAAAMVQKTLFSFARNSKAEQETWKMVARVMATLKREEMSA